MQRGIFPPPENKVVVPSPMGSSTEPQPAHTLGWSHTAEDSARGALESPRRHVRSLRRDQAETPGCIPLKGILTLNQQVGGAGRWGAV